MYKRDIPFTLRTYTYITTTRADLWSMDPNKRGDLLVHQNIYSPSHMTDTTNGVPFVIYEQSGMQRKRRARNGNAFSFLYF
jgi:hypothetical protein